jgi:hypothetical protein
MNLIIKIDHPLSTPPLRRAPLRTPVTRVTNESGARP